MAQAKAKMDEQYNEIMDLLNVVTGKELTKDEEKLVDGIMLKHIQEQKQKRSVDNGGQAPKPPEADLMGVRGRTVPPSLRPQKNPREGVLLCFAFPPPEEGLTQTPGGL